MKKGFFITLEGFEGSGKTTLAKMLHHIFLKNGFNALLTKEPGGTLVGDKIRKILLERESEGLGYKAELLLFAASRAENVRINIRPALEKGLIVISDRYFDSTTAYQGFGRGINMDIIEYLNKFAVEEVIPDLTFFLDVDAEIGLKRATAFGKGTELRFEDEFLQKKEVNGKLFLNRVRDGYYQIAKQNPERIKIIDTNRDISLVLNDIIKVLATRLSKKFNKELILEL
ncbi:MAG: dTMP kinase [Candidatus Caldatribacteriota bacterium]